MHILLNLASLYLKSVPLMSVGGKVASLVTMSHTLSRTADQSFLDTAFVARNLEEKVAFVPLTSIGGDFVLYAMLKRRRFPRLQVCTCFRHRFLSMA